MAYVDGVTPAPRHEFFARGIVQLAAGEFLVALADDGTAWEYVADAREWRALPALPKRIRGSA